MSTTADLSLDSDPEWLGCEAMLSIPGFALLGSLTAALRTDSSPSDVVEPIGLAGATGDTQRDPTPGA